MGYGDQVLCRDVSLHLGYGERAALIGRNGCGKTTLLRCIACCDPRPLFYRALRDDDLGDGERHRAGDRIRRVAVLPGRSSGSLA
jgi:ABC-type cobalamin/Fe3+-siderophores transport system ATPase subunit